MSKRGRHKKSGNKASSAQSADKAQCQIAMDAIIYTLCGISILLSMVSITISITRNVARRGKHGRREKKD